MSAASDPARSKRPLSDRCDLPPKGWSCNLTKGHDGPCPTRPVCVLRAGCVFGDDCVIDGCAERRAIATRYTAAVMTNLRDQREDE